MNADLHPIMPLLTASSLAADPPAPPPPSFTSRTMLPPSSPPHSQPQFNSHASTRVGVPLPPSFSGGRELPALPPNRSESSMSISSMLDSDSAKPTRERSTTFPNGSATSNPRHFSLPPARASTTVTSPRQQTQSQQTLGRRSPSPPGRSRPQGIVNRPSRAASNDAQRSLPPSAKRSPPRPPNFGSSLGHLVTQRSPTTESGANQQYRFSHHQNSSVGRLEQRPNSQPNGFSTPPRDSDPIPQPQSAISAAEKYRELNVRQRYKELAIEARREFDYIHPDRPSQAFLAEKVRRSQEQRTQEDRAASSAAQRTSPKYINRQSFTPRPGVTTEPTSNRIRSEIENVDHIYNRNPRETPNTVHSPFSPDSLRREREERMLSSVPQPPSMSQSGSVLNRFADRQDERQSLHLHRAPQALGSYTTRPMSTNGVDQVNKPGEDILQPQRNSLSLLIENGKRGRASPLPQAVQGAQGRISGPASDPGIKNEFGRMFSGIGSGVGSSGPIGSGASTPFSSSPKVSHEPERRTPFTARGEMIELAKPRDTSKVRRKRIVKDDDIRNESENGSAGAVVGASGLKGVKRKHQHQHHHHSHQ